MTLVLTIAIVVISFILHNTYKLNIDLKNQIDLLERKLSDLNEKTYYNYYEIQKLKTKEFSGKTPGSSQTAAHSVSTEQAAETNIFAAGKNAAKEVSQPLETSNITSPSPYSASAAVSKSEISSAAAVKRSDEKPAHDVRTAADYTDESKPLIKIETTSDYITESTPLINTENTTPQKTFSPVPKIQPVVYSSAQTAQKDEVRQKAVGQNSVVYSSAQTAQKDEVRQKAVGENSVVYSPAQTAQKEEAHQKSFGQNPVAKTGSQQIKSSFESWLGTRLFNIAASLMIFIGLILFCMLSYEYITNTMKMAAMFVVSGAFIGMGAFFTRKNKSIFSLGLTGCGFGAFFISILLSHVYFHAINDITAFTLLLLWSILALFLSRKLNSVTLSVTAHMGTAISICFAFSLGLSGDRIILPIVYQFCAIAVIVLGNIFCCRKTYRFGLFMSLCLLVYSSIVMCVNFSQTIQTNPFVVSNNLTPSFVALVFGVQLLAISFISYLISISTAALEKNISLYNVMIGAHFANKILWLSGISVSVGFASHFVFSHSFAKDGAVYPLAAVCVVLAAHFAVTLFMNEKLNFSQKLSNISIWFTSVSIMICLFIQAAARDIFHGIPFMFVFVGLLIIIKQFTKNKDLNNLISFIICCDMLFMCVYGYLAAQNIWISLVCWLIIGLEILLHWFLQNGEKREKYFTLFKMAEYLWLSISIIPINYSKPNDFSFYLAVSGFALLNIAAYLCRYARKNEPNLSFIVKLESMLTIYIGLIAVWNVCADVHEVLFLMKLIMTVFIGLLTGLYVKEFINTNSTGYHLLAAYTVPAFITALLMGFKDVIVPVSNIYIAMLYFKPFVFISVFMLILIYRRTKNYNLRPWLIITLGIDMFLMLFFGYGELINDYHSYFSGAISNIVLLSLCVVHAAAEIVFIYLWWKYKQDSSKKRDLPFVKTVIYFWVNFSFGAITWLETNKLDTGSSFEIMLVVLNVINIVFYLKRYHKSENSSVFETVLKVSYTILLYLSILAISDDFIEIYMIRIALIILSMGIYFLLSKDLLKSENVLIQAFVGISGTLIVNAVCRGLSNVFAIAYIFSIVTMITALICIGVGFAAKTKGLRVYGLILVMLCVIKLVTIDISGADTMSRVAAFVIGGIICFIISGIYNKVEDKILNTSNAQIDRGDSEV